MSKSLLCFLMTQDATYFVHLFRCIMFLRPLLLPVVKYHRCAAAKLFVLEVVKSHTNTGTNVNSLIA